MSEQPVFLLVRLEAGLHPSRVIGIGHAIVGYPGVEAVYNADLTGLPTDRLALLSGPKKASEPVEEHTAA